MLSSSMIKEEVDVIIESIVNTRLEEARQRLAHLNPQVSSEYGKGALLALNGIVNVVENKTPDKMADPDKILRAVDRIPKVEMTDDLDGSQADTTVSFAVDGSAYEIDLSKRNAAAMRKTFGRYIEHARKAGRREGERTVSWTMPPHATLPRPGRSRPRRFPSQGRSVRSWRDQSRG